MDDFRRYYVERFPADIKGFFVSIPEGSKFHEDSERRQIHSIQYERLSLDFNHLHFLVTEQEKLNFGVAIFFSVLIDEVFYTHFINDYDAFQKLTYYPKFIGNCPGGCHYHLHPKDIFFAINYSRKGNQGNLNFYETFKFAQPFLHEWIQDFLELNFPLINRVDFWNKCLKECPYKEYQ